jgi:hypothetical protein
MSLLLLFLSLFIPPSEGVIDAEIVDVPSIETAISDKPIIDKENCTCNGKKLYGRVKVVDNFPDFEVKIVKSFSDLDVKVVDNFPDECGKWQFVESFPDFTVKFVNSFPDFEVKYVNSFPGAK